MGVLVDEDDSIQPLISVEQRSHTATPTQADLYVANAEDNVTTAGWFLWLLTLAAGVSGLLFGYEYVPSRLRTLEAIPLTPSTVPASSPPP
jgi:hypothetical protein